MSRTATAQRPSAHQEVMRYMANAREYLVRAGKKDGDYADIKYVRTACRTAYNGVLLAVDEYLRRKEGTAYRRPKSIEEYRTRLSMHNKSLLRHLNTAYDILHIAGYYMGTRSAKTVALGMDEARKVIGHVK